MRFSSLMDYLFRIYEHMYYQQLEGHRHNPSAVNTAT
jgi:hypothetical protein